MLTWMWIFLSLLAFAVPYINGFIPAGAIEYIIDKVNDFLI